MRQKMRNCGVCRLIIGLFPLLAALLFVAGVCSQSQVGSSGICKPVLGNSPSIKVGKEGVFTWDCLDGAKEGSGYYIVFIRPSGTYVLLKVPQGRMSLQFTPDVPGTWRWIVINTDPDRTKADVESEPGHFQVVPAEGDPIEK
jgi:hypothetical protein